MPILLVPVTRYVIGLSIAKGKYGQFPANLYPAACASASVVKRTGFCGETCTSIIEQAA